MDPASIPCGVTGDFFRGSFRQNHVPWGRLSLWKWVPGISHGVKAAGAYGWQPTTLVVLNVEMIGDLNLPGTPRATSACRGTPSLYFYSRYMKSAHRSQWPRGLRRKSTADRLLRSWVRIALGAWMFVCCECCVLSGRGLCDGLITRPEGSYRLWCVVVCDQETYARRL